MRYLQYRFGMVQEPTNKIQNCWVDPTRQNFKRKTNKMNFWQEFHDANPASIKGTRKVVEYINDAVRKHIRCDTFKIISPDIKTDSASSSRSAEIAFYVDVPNNSEFGEVLWGCVVDRLLKDGYDRVSYQDVYSSGFTPVLTARKFKLTLQNASKYI